MPIKIIEIQTTGNGNKPEHIVALKTEHGIKFTRSEMFHIVKQGRLYAVNIDPYPILEAVECPSNDVGYVRSEGDGSINDNLMKLPRF